MTHFATSAARLAGLAAHGLAWPPEVFWNATPSELAWSLAPVGEGHEAAPSRAEIEHLIERVRNHG